MRIASIALAIALLSSLSVPAVAQDDVDTRARLHFEAARSHFDRGAYEDAQREFRAAYELSRRPALLYNLYLVAERLGELDAAIEHLERYLAEAEVDAELRAQLEPRLVNLRARRDRTRRAEAEAVETGPTPSTQPAPVAAPSTEPTSASRHEGDIVPAAIAFGVAGAALVSFAITGSLALGEDNSLAESCGATGSCTDDDVSTLSTLNTVADVSWVTAAVAAATGVVLLVTLGLPGETADESASVSHIAPWITPDGSAGIAAQVRF